MFPVIHPSLCSQSQIPHYIPSHSFLLRTGEVVDYEATLDTCVEGCDVTLQHCVNVRCDDLYMTLTPGTWKISFSYNAPAFNLVRHGEICL